MDAYRHLINRDLPWEERTCTSKVPYLTRAEARSVARDGRRSSSSALRPYHCPLGDHWHLAHRRASRARPGDPLPRLRRATARLVESAPWLAREWWAARGVRRLRPLAGERPWREAWAAG